jgi:PAS domain S-box-containing protein
MHPFAPPPDDALPLEQARALLRAAPGAFVVLRPEPPGFRIVEASDAYLALTMSRRDALLGRDLLQAFPENPDAHGSAGARNIRTSLELVVATGTAHTTAPQRYDLRGPDGTFEERYWVLSSVPVSDARGAPSLILHSALDVTASVRLEEGRRAAARESERMAELERAASEAVESRLNMVFAQAPTPLAVMRGPEHIFEVVNSRYLDLVGRRELIGRSVREAFPELEGEDLFGILDEVFATGKPFYAMERPVQLRRDGAVQEAILNFVYQPLLDLDGRSQGIAAVITDVTELVRVREAATRAAAEHDRERRQLLTVLEQSPLAIAIIEPPDGRIAFLNSKFGEIFGRAVVLDGIVSYSDHYRGFHTDGRPIASEEWPVARALRTGEIVEGELLEVERADGRRVQITVNAAPVRDGDGAIVAAMAFFRDVTAERLRDSQLRDAQRIQAVGKLAGGVAHEVNNQMTAVLGFGDFVLRALGPQHPQTSDMRQVLHAANRAAHVSQQLLTFTRQQVSRPSLIDLHALAADLMPVLQQLLGSDKHVTVLPGATARKVLADPQQVEQVLINLVANARDAMTTGGHVTIEIEEVLLEAGGGAPYGVAMTPGRYVLMTVADDGRGMDAATVARAFEPFFTTKGIGEGTGLGLSMVYGIVKQQGGYVWADSTPGGGASLRLYWLAAGEADLAREAPAAEEPARADAPRGGGSRLLLVEDEPTVRAMAVRALEIEGYEVAAAVDGAEALRLLDGRGSRPVIVVTDVIMPRVNGRQLHDALLAVHPGTPVLFMSGHAGGDHVLRSLLPPGAAFLQKPFTPGQLTAAVAALRAGAWSGSPLGTDRSDHP